MINQKHVFFFALIDYKKRFKYNKQLFIIKELFKQFIVFSRNCCLNLRAWYQVCFITSKLFSK